MERAANRPVANEVDRELKHFRRINHDLTPSQQGNWDYVGIADRDRKPAMRFVALDFETANEQRNSACAIGIAVVEDGDVVRTLHQLIRPHELRFSPRNVQIHGITPEQVMDAPTLSELWPSIWPIMESQLVVAHNASFDISVLRHSLHANALPIPELRYLCSLQLARKAWPELTSHSLSFLAAWHNIEIEHHNPESDAQAAARIMLRIASDQSVHCPFRLAERLGVSVGRLSPDGDWIPSTAPRFCTSADSFEVALPEDYDVCTHPLYGKNVAFTGTLQFFSRSQAFEIVELFGGSPQTTVTKKTDILVTGVQDISRLATGQTESSKLRKAMDLRLQGFPIQIITDREFQELVLQVSGDDEIFNSQCKDET